MTWWTRGVTLRGVSLTLCLAGAVLTGVSCRDDNGAGPTDPGAPEAGAGPATSVGARFDLKHVPRSRIARAPLDAIPRPSAAALAAWEAARAKSLGNKKRQPLTNGSFEQNGGEATSLFTGWTVVDIGADGNPPDGSWFVQTGEAAPVQGFRVAPPTDGAYAAMTDQFTSGTQILYQDILVPRHGRPVLSFDLQLQNLAETGWSSPNTLHAENVQNQQFRMDIVDPGAPIDDVGAGVLRQVYQTQPGDPPVTRYQTIQAPLAEFAGRTVRLRFAVVVNQNNLEAGIDRVIVGPRARLFREPKPK